MILFGCCGLRGSLTVPKSSSGLVKMLYCVYIHLFLSRLGTKKKKNQHTTSMWDAISPRASDTREWDVTITTRLLFVTLRFGPVSNSQRISSDVKVLVHHERIVALKNLNLIHLSICQKTHSGWPVGGCNVFHVIPRHFNRALPCDLGPPACKWGKRWQTASSSQ